MCPPPAVQRCVWVFLWDFGEPVVDSVQCHPDNSEPLLRERRYDSKSVLHPPIGFEASVSEEPVITNTNPKTAGDSPDR
jgi:hypothetical protein